LAIASTSDVRGSITTAVAPRGENFLPTPGQDLLRALLDRRVERELQLGAVPRRDDVLDVDGVPQRVLDRPPGAVRAREPLVLGVLEAREAVALHPHRPEHLGRQHPAGILALLRGSQRDPGEAQLADPLGLRGRDGPGEVDEARVAAGQLAQQLVLGPPEQPRQALRRPRSVLHEVRGRGDVGGGIGDRQLQAVAVRDRPPARRDDLLRRLLAHGGLREAVAADRPEPQRADEGE
jgi:hypothetical protein